MLDGQYKEYFTAEYLKHLLDSYHAFGPIIGISLPFIEAFLPFLPLVVFVVANASAFGLLNGFIYSLTGSCLGAVLLFYIIRRFGQKRFFSFLNTHVKVRKTINWIERHGFGPIFLLFCFPFTPSVLIIIVAGLSRVSIIQFLLALVLGKTVMIFTISFIGQDITSFFHSPLKTIIVIASMGLLWLGGKGLERKFNLNK
ncbi:MAG: TVP38/TMEM64 family protein [Bacillaceae bacterium]